MVHGELEELPHHPHGHGEAEGHHCHVEGAQVQRDPFGAVENVHQGKANGGAQKAVGGVEHGVPVGEGDVVVLNFAQNLRSEDKQQNDDLQGVRQFNAQPPLEGGGEHEQHQGEDTQGHIFIILIEYGGHQHEDHQHTQHKVHRVQQSLSLKGVGLGAGGTMAIRHDNSSCQGWGVWRIGWG